ncbi:MAG: ABC transporter substrate-binding protein [Aristaeellaceae bacterium]
MNRKLLALLTALLLLAAPAALAETAPLRAIVVAEPVHLIGYLPLYVAIHEGYFAEEGLDVTVVQATGGAHVTAVVSGDAFAVIGGVDSYNFANQGNSDPIRAIVNCVNRANVYLFARKGLVPASDSAEDLADFLRGRIIVAGRYGGSPNVLTRYLVKSVGLDPDRDVTLSENADASTVTAMLRYGQGDIGNGGEPQISEGVTAGIFEEPFIKFPDLGDYAYSVIGVKQSTIDYDPDTCERFVRAMLRALRVVQTDRATAERVLAIEFSTLTEEGRQAALDRAYEDHLWSEDGFISRAAVDTCMEVVSISGLYDGTWDYGKIVDMQFVEKLTEKAPCGESCECGQCTAE